MKIYKTLIIFDKLFLLEGVLHCHRCAINFSICSKHIT